MSTAITEPSLPAEVTIEASFADMAHARQAASALARAGIAPADVELSGPASETLYYREETMQRDMRVAKGMVGNLALGVAIGTPIAGLAGALAGLFTGRAYGLDGYDAWLTCGLGALLGGLIGAYVGAFVGAAIGLRIDVREEPHFEEDVREHEPGVISVHVTSAASAERAAAILRAKEPISVQRRPTPTPQRVFDRPLP